MEWAEWVLEFLRACGSSFPGQLPLWWLLYISTANCDDP
jgi:hypothetical protein